MGLSLFLQKSLLGCRFLLTPTPTRETMVYMMTDKDKRQVEAASELLRKSIYDMVRAAATLDLVDDDRAAQAAYDVRRLVDQLIQVNFPLV